VGEVFGEYRVHFERIFAGIEDQVILELSDDAEDYQIVDMFCLLKLVQDHQEPI